MRLVEVWGVEVWYGAGGQPLSKGRRKSLSSLKIALPTRRAVLVSLTLTNVYCTPGANGVELFVEHGQNVCNSLLNS